MALRVLVVEDDVLVAMMLEDMLLELDHEVIGPVTSLDAAEKAVAREVFDLAVSDLHLHGRDTLALCAALLARNIPVVLSTGHDDRGLVERFPKAVLLQKPFTTDELDLAIRQAVRNHSS